MEDTIKSLQAKGFNDFFAGKHYAAEKSVHWMNGWVTAERESRCGNYDRYGNATPCYS